MGLVLVCLAVGVQEYEENGTAGHDSDQDHICDIDPVQQTYGVSDWTEGQVDQKVEDYGRNQQQDAVAELPFGQVRLPLGSSKPEVAFAEPAVDTLEYPVHAYRDQDNTDQCSQSVYCVRQFGLHLEMPDHDVVQPLNYSRHNVSFLTTYSNIRANKKLAPKSGPVIFSGVSFA